MALKHDPIEDTEQYKAIEPELEAKIDAELKGIERHMGYCFRYWNVKAEILRRDYGIEWQSPTTRKP